MPLHAPLGESELQDHGQAIEVKAHALQGVALRACLHFASERTLGGQAGFWRIFASETGLRENSRKKPEVRYSSRPRMLVWLVGAIYECKKAPDRFGRLAKQHGTSDLYFLQVLVVLSSL